MKTYTIKTEGGRVIAENVSVEELLGLIPSGFNSAGDSSQSNRPQYLFKKKVGPSQFETIIVMEDQKL